MNRLVLIDGNAILHRAYHALPLLTAPDGSLVNAVYGFTSMLLKIVNDLKPSHLAVAFDRPAPTFREKLYKEYQAQRPKMEDELVPQVDKVHDLLRAFGVPIFEKDGYEADDVIGTLAAQAISDKQKVISKTKNLSPIASRLSPSIDQVIIVTGDRDLLQLVEDNQILAYMPIKGLSEAKLYGEKEVKEKLGVEPKQIPDFKALSGDPSDNYPGVSGIGPKTAADLLAKFGFLETLLTAIREHKKVFRELPKALQDKLKFGVKTAVLSKQLATIRTDAPIDASLDAMKISTLATPQSRMKLAELGFKSLLKRLSEKRDEKEPEPRKKTSKEEQLTLM